jgi:hypothetical protein
MMVKRYLTLVQFDLLSIDATLTATLLTTTELKRIEALYKHFQSLETYTKVLQSGDITLEDVRFCFDEVIDSFPQLSTHLAANAEIVHCPYFESAIVKILEKNENLLSEQETIAVHPFRKPVETYGEDSFATLEARLNARKKAKLQTNASSYTNVAWIPATSNIVERLFSRMKMVFSPRRQRMNPATIECVMMLLCNRDLWDLSTVNEIFHENKSACNVNDVDDEEEQDEEDENEENAND